MSLSPEAVSVLIYGFHHNRADIPLLAINLSKSLCYKGANVHPRKPGCPLGTTEVTSATPGLHVDARTTAPKDPCLFLITFPLPPELRQQPPYCRTKDLIKF